MSRFNKLIKTNLKLLLRNKGFIFFLLLTPIISVFILTIDYESAAVDNEVVNRKIVELDEQNTQVIYETNRTAFSVKVFDKSNSKLSEYMLSKLTQSGMFLLCRYKAADMNEDAIITQVKTDAFNDRYGVCAYIKEDFNEAVIKGDYDAAVHLFEVSDDERKELFYEELTLCLSDIKKTSQAVIAVQKLNPNDVDKVEAGTVDILNKASQIIPQKKVNLIDDNGDINLTPEQNNKKELVGYAMAIITLGFLFCGICVAYTIIEEKDNKVYTRIMLTKSNRLQYLLSKLTMCVIISAVQTMIMGICLFLIKDIDFGIDRLSFLYLIFLLGLIFSILSLSIGILIGDIMSSNYAVFIIWSVSSLLAGMYFPIEGSSVVIKTLAYLMPQRWSLKAAEMLITGDKSAYSMILYIMAAYLIVILSIGAVGLKLKKDS